MLAPTAPLLEKAKPPERLILAERSIARTTTAPGTITELPPLMRAVISLSNWLTATEPPIATFFEAAPPTAILVSVPLCVALTTTEPLVASISESSTLAVIPLFIKLSENAIPMPAVLPPANPPPKENMEEASEARTLTSPAEVASIETLIMLASTTLPIKLMPKVPPKPTPPVLVATPIEPVTAIMVLSDFASTSTPLLLSEVTLSIVASVLVLISL